MDRSSDFRILNPPKPPLWRDQRRLAKLPRELNLPRGLVVGTFSALCCLACLVPNANGYREAISIQIARGEPLAWLIIVSIGGAALSAVPHFVKAGRYLSGLF